MNKWIGAGRFTCDPEVNTDLYHVHCIHCGAMGAGAQSVEWAVANWNGRLEK